MLPDDKIPEDNIELSEQDLERPEPKQRNTKGILVTVLVLLVVAGVSFAGWTWYTQSKTYKDENGALQQQVTQLQSQVDKQTADKTLTVDGGDKTISVAYPYNWLTNKTTHNTELVDNNVPVEDATVTSPTSKTVVTIQTGITGIGGACIASENPDYVMDVFKTEKLSSDKSYSYIEYYSVKSGQYGAYIAQTSSIAKAKQGSNVCDIAFTEFMGHDDKDGLFSLMVTSPALEKLLTGNQKPTKAQLDTFFASKEFAQAKSMLLSAKITKQ